MESHWHPTGKASMRDTATGWKEPGFLDNLMGPNYVL